MYELKQGLAQRQSRKISILLDKIQHQAIDYMKNK